MSSGLLNFAYSFNNNRVTLNAPSGYTNLAKGFGFSPDPNNQTSNGYPVTLPTSGYGSNPSFPLNYYGQFVWKWSGIGAMGWAGAPIIVTTSTVNGTNSPVLFELPGGTGDLPPGNHSFIDQGLSTGLNNPRLVFSIGWNIQSISNSITTPGLITINCKTNYVGVTSGPSGGETVFISGANSNTGANGTWIITNVTASSFDLTGSLFTNVQFSAAGTAIYGAQNQSVSFSPNGFGPPSYSMTNLVICKLANETAATAGTPIYDSVLTSEIKTLLNPGNLTAPNVWLRFMDFTGVQGSWESDYSQRITPSHVCFSSTNFCPGYWIGAITHGGSDAYSCSDPGSGSGIQVWNGSNYVDNGIVQGNVSVTNSGSFPTLAVGSGPAKPIFNYFGGLGAYQYFANTNPASAGLSMVFTFTASWLSGLPGVVGTTYTVTYTTVSADVADTTGFTLTVNLIAKFQGDSTLTTAGIQFANPLNSIYPRTAQAGRLTFAYTIGPAIMTVQTTPPSTVATGNCSFMYNYLLDGWLYKPGGIVMSGPLEMAVEICNAVNAHCWWNWSTTKSSYISSATTFFGTNLNSGLKFGQEPGNEIWNTSAYPSPLWGALGLSLGFTVGSDNFLYSYGALRCIQYNAIAKTAWTGTGRSASDLWVLQPSATFDIGIGSGFDTNQLKGTALNASSNTVYGAYGGLNGSGTSPSYNSFPNRPVDITNSTGCAPYWSSHWLGNGGSVSSAGGQFQGLWGSVSQNIPWLQASLDYANGNTATAFTAMTNIFNGVTTGGPASFQYNFVDMQSTFTSEEAMCAQYDGARPSGMANLIIMDYECGPSWGVGADGNNGINSVNSTDIGAMVTQFGVLGWITTQLIPYTSSGTGNLTEMATMACKLFQGWKYDTDHTGAAANTGSYKNMIKTNYYAARNTANTHRETHAAQFGYAPAGQWGLYATDYNLTPYTSYNAISEFNT